MVTYETPAQRAGIWAPLGPVVDPAGGAVWAVDREGVLLGYAENDGAKQYNYPVASQALFRRCPPPTAGYSSPTGLESPLSLASDERGCLRVDSPSTSMGFGEGSLAGDVGGPA